MIWTVDDFMGGETQKIPSAENLGEALQQAAKRRWAQNTAKHAAAAWGLDLKTAMNVAEGKAGAVVVAKALKAEQAQRQEAWKLWLEMGRSLIGEDLDTFEDREVHKIIEITENAKRVAVASRERRREKRSRLEERARALVDLGDRMAS